MNLKSDEIRKWFHSGKSRHDISHRPNTAAFNLRTIKDYKLASEDSFEDRDSYSRLIYSKLHGCRGDCPYYGTKTCPFGIGKRKYTTDLSINGELIKKEGDFVMSVDQILDANISKETGIQVQHIGICRDREMELAREHSLASTLTGLKELSAKNLTRMGQDLEKMRQSRDSIIEERGWTLNVVSDGIDPVTGQPITDIKLLELVKEISVLEHKYQEKIDNLISIHSRKEQDRVIRLEADDIAQLLKTAKKQMVTIDAEFKESVDLTDTSVTEVGSDEKR
jgi:hypothetical protein